MTRIRAFASAALALCATILAASSSPASAHAGLESSIPSPSAVLESSPRDIVLEFSEPVSVVEGSVELFDERSSEVALPVPVSMLSNRIEVRDVPRLEPGLYLVSWRVLSQDGHLAQGAFTFQIGTRPASVTSAELLANVDSEASGTFGMGMLRHTARAVTYLGSAAVLGTLLLAAAVGLRRVRTIVATGWIAAAIGTAIQFMTQAALASGGGWSALVDFGSWADVSSTRLGRGLVARLVLLVALAGLIAAVRRRPVSHSGALEGGAVPMMSTTWWRSSSALVGSGIIVTFAATGHPSASSPAALASAIDAVHFGAALLWIGGLFGILFGSRDAGVVRSYSRVATVVLPLAVGTGVWQAWHLYGDGNDLTSTEWGRALVVKTSLVLIAATIGMMARWLVRSNREAPIRRLVAVEVVTAAAVIAATSVMVASPPRTQAEAAVITASLAQDDIIANVTVTPGGIGSNEIHVTVMTPGGTLSPVEEVTMRLTEIDSDIPPVAVDVDVLGPNHFLGTVSILERGEWTLELLVGVTPSRVVRLSTTFDV